MKVAASLVVVSTTDTYQPPERELQCKQTGRQADRQAGRQAGRQAVTLIEYLLHTLFT